ncbi:hypothetical protein KR215_009577, partial [Drosophila sulfurigaster]
IKNGNGSDDEANVGIKNSNGSDDEANVGIKNSDGSDEFLSAEEDVRVGPGRPRIVRTGMRGRPRKQFNLLGAATAGEIPIPET